jgi:hypothetical protein
LRRYTVLAIAAIVTGLLVGVVIASSGGDGGGGTTTQPLPELKPPGGSIGTNQSTDTTSTDTTSTDTQTQTQPTQTQAPSGGSQAPPADTKSNDTPPPAGSPAQRFEDFCAQNPGAC